jgi:hypothetical protein
VGLEARAREQSGVPSADLVLSHLIHGAVMLSEALQRNAKHEARLSNISGYFR